MKLHDLKANEGARKESVRVGRGIGSGIGRTSGRGEKGLKSRTGHHGGVRPGFEGGQTVLFRRLSKRGFNNPEKNEYAIVNLQSLNVFEDGSVIDTAKLIEAGLIKKELDGVKVLGQGKLTKKLTVKASKFSKNASSAIEAAGGKAEVI